MGAAVECERLRHKNVLPTQACFSRQHNKTLARSPPCADTFEAPGRRVLRHTPRTRHAQKTASANPPPQPGGAESLVAARSSIARTHVLRTHERRTHERRRRCVRSTRAVCTTHTAMMTAARALSAALCVALAACALLCTVGGASIEDSIIFAPGSLPLDTSGNAVRRGVGLGCLRVPPA